MEQGEQAPFQPAWAKELEPREWSQVRHAQAYARNHIGAGAPGHGQFLLIAKLAAMLDAQESNDPAPEPTTRTQKIVWDEAGHCWRDVVTGVRVEVA